MGEYIYRDRWIKNYNKKQLDEKNFLLVSHSGDWEIISEEEMLNLEGVALPEMQFKRLEDKGLIITGDNSNRVFERYTNWNSNKYEGTSLHIIEITRNCNLQCVYCHASAQCSTDKETIDKNNLSRETAKKIVDFIFQTPKKEIVIEFQGGEALLNMDVIKFIVEYSQSLNLKYNKDICFSLVTNLISLTKEDCSFIKRHGIKLSSSMDGPKYLHDSHRKFSSGKGSFEKLIKSLKLLQQEEIEFPGFLTVITKKSMSYYKEIIDMFEDIGIKNLNFIYVNPLGEATKEWQDVGISAEEKCEHYKKVMDYIFSKWRKGKFLEERMIILTLKKIIDNKDIGFMDFRNPCGMIRGQLAYGVNGDIYTCDDGRNKENFKIGSVNNDTYEGIINSDKSKRLISKSIPNYPGCESCAYSTFCCICPVINDTTIVSEKTRDKDYNCKFIQTVFEYCFNMIIKEPDLVKSYLLYKNYLSKGYI